MMHKPRQGLTFIELMVAVVILGVLAAVGVPSMYEWVAKRRVQAAADELLTDLRYAKSIQLANNNKVAIRFASNASMACYVIYDLPLFGNCNCLNTNTPVCSSPAIREHKTVRFPVSGPVRLQTLAGSATMVRLDGITGLPVSGASFNVQVSAPSGGAIRVMTNGAFSAEACSASNQTSAFAACP